MVVGLMSKCCKFTYGKFLCLLIKIIVSNIIFSVVSFSLFLCRVFIEKRDFKWVEFNYYENAHMERLAVIKSIKPKLLSSNSNEKLSLIANWSALTNFVLASFFCLK